MCFHNGAGFSKLNQGISALYIQVRYTMHAILKVLVCVNSPSYTHSHLMWPTLSLAYAVEEWELPSGNVYTIIIKETPIVQDDSSRM